MSMIFGKTLESLHRGLGQRQERAAVIAANVANADTPGYKARKITFEGALDSANARQMMKTRNHHMTPRGAAMSHARQVTLSNERHLIKISQGPSSADALAADIHYDKAEGRIDGNNVDLEDEMTMNAINATEYSALATITKKKLGLLRYVVQS